MATGIIKIDDQGVWVRLLKNLAAAQGAPADGGSGDMLKAKPTSTTFYDFADLRDAWLKQFGVPFLWPELATVFLYETAGSGTITLAYARLWLYSGLIGKAFPAGIGADAAKGYLNGGSSFGETGTDKLRHCEPLMFPGQGDGMNIELGTYGGTNPTFNVDVFFPAPSLTLTQYQQLVTKLLGNIADVTPDAA